MRQNHVTDLCDSCVVVVVFSSVLWRARRATGSAHARGRDHWRATCRLLHNVLELKQQTNLVGSRRELLATRCSRAVARSADSIVAILFWNNDWLQIYRVFVVGASRGLADCCSRYSRKRLPTTSKHTCWNYYSKQNRYQRNGIL